MNRVILVHGFNVRDKGAGTTGRLAAKLRKIKDCEVIEFTPGWRGLVGVRVSNKRRAQQLAKLVKEGDLLIGHSDGCNLIDMACHELSSLYPAKINCVYINPALDRDTALAPIVNKCLVFHTETDHVVWISKWLAFHPWGEMGKKGYKPTRPSLRDDRYQNVAYEGLGYHSLGHNGVFHNPDALNDCLAIIQINFTEVPKAVIVPEP